MEFKVGDRVMVTKTRVVSSALIDKGQRGLVVGVDHPSMTRVKLDGVQHSRETRFKVGWWIENDMLDLVKHV